MPVSKIKPYVDGKIKSNNIKRQPSIAFESGNGSSKNLLAKTKRASKPDAAKARNSVIS